MNNLMFELIFHRFMVNFVNVSPTKFSCIRICHSCSPGYYNIPVPFLHGEICFFVLKKRQ